MIIKQHKLYVPKLEDFADINDFLKACSLYNELINKRTEMKSYTDVEQSKKLAEILPVESADMTWEQVDLITGDLAWKPLLGLDVAIRDNLFSYRNGYMVPCWSLAALLEQIPSDIKTKDSCRYTLEIEKRDAEHLPYGLNYHDTWGRGEDIITHYCDNLVDACVEMILRLNELKML